MAVLEAVELKFPSGSDKYRLNLVLLTGNTPPGVKSAAMEELCQYAPVGIV
jgi:hypothetical protein